MTKKPEKVDRLKLLKTFALGALTGGAVLSLYITSQARNNNKSILLVLLFMIWVLSPFIILLRLNTVSTRWTKQSRVTLYVFMLVVTVLSLFLYAGLIRFSGVKHSFVFLVTPLITWILLALMYFSLRTRNDTQ